MKKLLNTLYVTSPNAFLSLKDENVLVEEKGRAVIKVPLINLESIFCFSYFGATANLMSKCAEKGVALSFLNEYGKYLGTLYGETKGNVILRREQFRIADNQENSLMYAKNFIFGKLHNQRRVLYRAISDYNQTIDVELIRECLGQIAENQRISQRCLDLSCLRALEGNAAQAYFRAFNELVLHNKETFFFMNRSKRPPKDPLNSLLSLAYTLLAAECRHALEANGLDSYVGFMHKDRSGRASLALDLMEELRGCFADRFVLNLINRKQLCYNDFDVQLSGAVLLKANAKKKVLAAWQDKKREKITHPFLNEKIYWGLVPHVQSLLLARTIRGDLERYPPFLWR